MWYFLAILISYIILSLIALFAAKRKLKKNRRFKLIGVFAVGWLFVLCVFIRAIVEWLIGKYLDVFDLDW